MSIEPNTLALLGIAALQCITAVLAFWTHNVAKETKSISLKTEQNTNSMKDALVKATGEAAHAAGVEQARAAAAVIAEALATEVAKREKDRLGS